MPYAIKITTSISDDLIEQIIDSASTGIAYWAEEATVHRAQKLDGAITGYTVEWAEEEGLSLVRQSKRLKPQTIAGAIEKILTPGKVQLNDRIRDYIARLDPCDIDDDAADVIIQVAIFGEIVYG